MDPLTIYGIGAGISGLGSWLSGSAAERSARKELAWKKYLLQVEQARRAGATRALGGYGYQAYESPVLARYLAGELTPAQQATISQQQRLGEATIARRAAGMGMPSGAQAGLYGQLGSQVALGAGQLAGQQQLLGLQYSMADWARQQEAEQRRKELLAQYAT